MTTLLDGRGHAAQRLAAQLLEGCLSPSGSVEVRMMSGPAGTHSEQKEVNMK